MIGLADSNEIPNQASSPMVVMAMTWRGSLFMRGSVVCAV